MPHLSLEQLSLEQCVLYLVYNQFRQCLDLRVTLAKNTVGLLVYILSYVFKCLKLQQEQNTMIANVLSTKQ